MELTTAQTASGENVTIEVADGGVEVDGSNVVATDIQASRTSSEGAFFLA